MKHILLAGNTAWGMHKFRIGIISHLVQIGYKVTVVAPEDTSYRELIETSGAHFTHIDIEAKGLNPVSNFKLINKFKRIFQKEAPDFIFFYTIKPNIFGSIAASALKIPHIAITTGLGYTFIKSNIISQIARILYKIGLKNTSEVWFLNTEDKIAFINYGLIQPEKAVIINGEGINLDLFKKTNNQSENISFLLIGRLLWDKGIGEFAQAARILKAKYPSVQFSLLGFLGANNPSAISEKQINEWKQEGILSYLGATNNVTSFIKKSSCIVLPSYREGLPISLLEAASMCKPIITTNTCGCKEIVMDNISGFLCQVRSTESLINALEKMINSSPEERQKMGEAGRNRVELLFDEKHIFKHYVKTLEQHLGS